MMRSYSIALLILVFGCGPVHNQIRPQASAISKLDRIGVVFKRDGVFAFIDEQARRAAAPSGLVGLGMYSAAVSADEKSAAAIGAGMSNPACRSIFESAFREAMSASQHPRVEILASRPAMQPSFDAILEFDIEHCGFRLVNRSIEEMAAFIQLRARLELASGETGWDDRETVIGTTRFAPGLLKSEQGLGRAEFEDVLAVAGRRMAHNLIYP